MAATTCDGACQSAIDAEAAEVCPYCDDGVLCSRCFMCESCAAILGDQ